MKRTSIIRRGHEFVIRANPALLSQVRQERAQGIADRFWTSTRRDRRSRAEHRSSEDLYQQSMAAKGFPVRLGPVS